MLGGVVMKIGTVFEHKHWLRDDGTKRKLLCIVTSKSRGAIYWKEWDEATGEKVGKSLSFHESETDRYVGKVVAEP